MKEKKNAIRTAAVFISLAVLLIISILINCGVGSVNISPAEIIRIIFGDTSDEASRSIIMKIRLPRLLTAAILGGALSLSGYLLQTFFRNPVAGPFILGISSGAKLFLAAATIATAGIFTEIKVQSLPVSLTVISAFAGSMLSMLAVLLFSGKVRSMSSLLIIGVMISYVCSSATDFLINFANEQEIVNLTHWSMGSFSGASWKDVIGAACIVLPTFAAVWVLSKPISAYNLGEGYADSIGVNIKLLRAAIVVLSSILAAAVVAFAGPVAFVGIAVPHIMRISLRTQRAHVMTPAVFLGGAAFCLLCDFAARMAFSPTELSIGTVTGAVGAPVVIWLMLSRRKKNYE